MPIYTPRGLKVRIDPLHAFALMARLEPDVKPIQVLRTTEALEHLSTVCSILAALAALWIAPTLATVTLATLAGGIVGGAVSRYGLFMVPGLVSLGRLYSFVSGFGIVLVLVIGTAWLRASWAGVSGYLVGRVGAGLTNGALNLQRSRVHMRVLGHPLTASEINFFNAYRLHASATGKSLDLEVSDGERKATAHASIERFAAEWPVVAGRIATE